MWRTKELARLGGSTGQHVSVGGDGIPVFREEATFKWIESVGSVAFKYANDVCGFIAVTAMERNSRVPAEQILMANSKLGIAESRLMVRDLLTAVWKQPQEALIAAQVFSDVLLVAMFGLANYSALVPACHEFYDALCLEHPDHRGPLVSQRAKQYLQFLNIELDQVQSITLHVSLTAAANAFGEALTKTVVGGRLVPAKLLPTYEAASVRSRKQALESFKKMR